MGREIRRTLDYLVAMRSLVEMEFFMIRRFFMQLFLFFAFMNPAHATESCPYVPTKNTGDEKVILKQGINLPVWWEDGKREGIKREKFDDIKNLGFTFVRVPIDPQYLESDDEATQKENLLNLRCNVISALNNGLAVIIDLHPTQKFHKSLGGQTRHEQLGRLVKLWHKLRFVTEGLPEENVYLQVLNEPIEKVRKWWDLQGTLISNLRAIYPRNTLIVSAYYSSQKRLYKELPYPDKNLLYDFHFYKPHFFTHHGAPWFEPPVDPREQTDNIQYPVTATTKADDDYEKMGVYLKEGWNKQKMEEHIKPNVDWAAKHGVKLICLEFGVLKEFVDRKSRINWIRDAREALEGFNIPWAVWNSNTKGFGVFEQQNGMEKDMMNALGLSGGDKMTVGKE